MNRNDIAECFISVDPGSEGTGVALFGPLTDTPKVIQNLNSSHKEWNKKCDEICYKFKAFLKFHVPYSLGLKIFCEQPQFFESFIGLTAAKGQTPIKLTVLFGRLWQISTDIGIDFIPVKINDWKGQMNKQQTATRVSYLIKQEYKTTHETDAVGIGLFIKGLF